MSDTPDIDPNSIVAGGLHLDSLHSHNVESHNPPPHNLQSDQVVLDEVVARIADGTAIVRGEHDAVVWSPAATEPTYLDPVAALYLDLFDGVANLEELVEDIVSVLEVDPEIAQLQTARVYSLLQAAGALTATAIRPPREVELPGPLMTAPDW